MSKIATAINLLKHNGGEFFASILMHLNFLFPDKLYLTLLFRLKMGYWMDWKNPKTFSEKLQFLKLYNRKPEYTQMVDKYAVKEYVDKIIGEEYIIPTLGVWDRPEDIDWDSLPQKFVLKTTHGGGSSGVVICKDKSTFNKADAIAKLKKSLNECIYKSLREWPYKGVQKRIIAEQYLSDESIYNKNGITDYKFFCFNGYVDNVMVCIDRELKDTKFYFFDKDWKVLPLNKRGLEVEPDFKLPKPKEINKMFEIAGKLSESIPFLRVDLYFINNKIYFGETTFFPYSGFDSNLLHGTEIKFGNLINLNINK